MERRLAAVFAADMVGFARLMEADETGVLTRQKSHRKELIDPRIASHHGRIVKTTGDGMLAEFPSAQDAVRCALDIQSGMAEREAHQGEDRRIRYRVGINLGDVIHDGDDIFGDGVNVAARLEGLAEPGGVCISDIVHQTVLDRLPEPFRDMGSQRVKNISRPIRVWQWAPGAEAPREAPEVSLKQRVRYATSADGTQIAWASVGEGPPVLKAPNWLNHIEYEWTSPIWGPFLAEFARQHRLVRFDQRGNGLSDWEVERLDHDAMIEDTEAVIAAAGLDRFALFGISQGAAISIRYAVEHPGRVRCLILLGGYVRGRRRRGDPEAEKFERTAEIMIRDGWGSPNPVYRNFFTTGFVPEATPAEAGSFDELQRISTNAENALRILEMNGTMDVTDLCARVEVPTLVLHMRGDRIAPVEEGQRIARLIPGAQFVELPGNNHAMLESHPGFHQFFEEVRAFLAEHG